MNTKTFLFLLICLLFQFTLFSQEKTEQNEPPQEKSKFWKKVRYGGSFNMSFANNNTFIGLAPSAIYQFNKNWSAGTSVGFGYTNFSRGGIKQYNYGGSLIGIYSPYRLLQFSTELEQTFVNRSINQNNSNFDFLALYLGLGYQIGNITTGFRYDVLFKENRNLNGSAFSPFVRVFF